MMAKLRKALPYIFLFLLTALALDLGNPFFDKPARDGGFFLYAGSQILNGKIPYQDFWDSKGPGIFYINALGLLLGNGSRWGVWFVEFICIFGTLILLYATLSKRWGIGAALFGSLMAGLGLHAVLGYGNYTEEFALLFNAAGLVLFFSMVDVEQNYWKYIWVGALFGLSFTFRANNIGGLFAIMGAIVLYYGSKRHVGEVLRLLLVILAGFVLPLILWSLYFALLGDAWEMINASIVFNFTYSAAKDRALLDIFGGFGRYGMGWVGWFTLAAWFGLGLRFLVSFMKRKVTVFETFLLIWFPIEILLSNLSGRNFAHYYISWTLAVAVYSAFIFAEFWQVTFKVSSLEGWSEGLGAIVSTILVVLLFIIFPSSWGRYGETIRAGGGEYIDPVSAYIRDNSSPEDLVLTWYPEMGVNFMAGRTSPVKYLYYPLFLEGSLTKEIEDRYISDLTSNPPELILDCSRSVDAIPSLDPAAREEQYSTPGVKKKMYIQPSMDDIFEFVEANYQLENTIDPCLVFRLKN
ncbi:MAG: glycosyltransferase family 39 protein [Anaerolineales bacterium]|nr:glycosyltransferase family 39 protein [Anaerolineales bacterium]